MGKLQDKVALITGGTTGIGLASAMLFRDEGAKVIVTGVNQSNLDKVARIEGIDALRCDQSNIADIENMIATVRETHGDLDVLFVNAGIPGSGHPLGRADEDTFDRIVGTNLKGVLFTTQAALPWMADGGSIVLTSSIAAHSALPGGSIYAASKAGVRAFARTWAAELLPRRIRVNTLTPGLIDTPLLDRIDMPPEARSSLTERIPMGRAGAPVEAATAALFLASDDSSFMTGGEIIVSGGQLNL